METIVRTTADGDKIGGSPEQEDSGLESVRYWLNGFATNVLVVVGLIANGLTLAVLCRRLMTSSTNSYLSTLAVWDSVVLICTGLLIGLPAVFVSYQQQVGYSLYTRVNDELEIMALNNNFVNNDLE